MNEELNKMRKLVDKLNEASKYYYQYSSPIMTDYEPADNCSSDSCSPPSLRAGTQVPAKEKWHSLSRMSPYSLH